ncbi:HNH endonuclease signature motif containing protein [Agromyces bauzanensis]|uniref:HNH nuclease domain-containing protein n=1 Tax=Agromyces bauzanensis TaxID=1308924 RepID=A0A917PSZ8_9MICO|nr:HNH endonuclease signature motif containing protein [Agromyces bauzanensis]GGJ90070.1 hypothetical protein GCM10011372_30770 [Agromyces bauzanensis]
MPEIPAALGELLAEVDAFVGAWGDAVTLASSDPAADVLSMTDAGLLAVTEALAGLSKRVDALTVRCAAGLTRRSPSEAGNDGLARRTGHSTPAGLIATMKGGRYSEAVKLIAVGEATEPRAAFTGERLPPRFAHVAAGVGAGRLGVEAAAVITAFLTRVSVRASADDLAWSEAMLVERGPVVGVDGLNRLIKQLEARLDPDGVRPREDELHGQRSLRIWEDSAGMINLRGRFDPVTGAPIKVAVESLVGAELHRARDARPGFGETAAAVGADAAGGAVDAALAGDPARAGDPALAGDPARAGASRAAGASGAADAAFAEQRSIDQMNADALADVARLAISSAGASLPALGFATVVARIDHDSLLTGRGHATIDGIDQPVSATTARQLAASAGVIPMVCGGEGEVLDLGRGKRLFTKAQRLALAERDGGCAHPGCRRPIAHTQAHHIRWWKRHHGPTDLENGVLLCAFHHGLLHRNGWSIEIRDNRAWFIPPPHIDPEQRPRAGNRSPHLEIRHAHDGQVVPSSSRSRSASGASAA